MSSVLRMRAAGALLLLCALPGCTAAGALSGRAIEFNQVFAEAADSQLLLNIVRAAFRNPTRYTAVSQLREARSAQGSFTLGGQAQLSPHRLASYSIGPSTTTSGSQQPSFDVAPLDDRKAVLGLYQPIKSETFLSYWRQGWPRAVLLFLLVDDVELNHAAKTACGITGVSASQRDGSLVYNIDNTAFDEQSVVRFAKFYHCVRRNMELVEVDKVTSFVKDSPVPPGEIVKNLSELTKNSFSVKERTDGARRLYTISKSSTKSGFNLTFGNKLGVGLLESSQVSSGAPQATFYMRSVDGMIYYLGELLRLQIEGKSLPPILYGHGDTPVTLFQVDLNPASNRDEQIEVEFLDRRFAIRRDLGDGDLTLTVLSLLSQMFSLYREGTELPRTIAVQTLGAP